MNWGNLDWSMISAVISGITALAAIIAPTVSTIFTLRHQTKMKKLELYSPRVFDIIGELSEAYARLSYFYEEGASSATAYDNLQKDMTAFSAICHRLCALIPNEDIHAKTAELLDDLTQRGYLTGQSTNALFEQLITLISKHLRRTAVTTR